MKRFAIIIAMLSSPLGWSQSIPISGQVLNQYGNPVSGAQVYICSASSSSGLPCSPVASIYQDYNLTTAISNPTQTDANGNFSVYVGPLAFPNTYVVNEVPESGTTYTLLYPGPSCPLSGCTFTGEVTGTIFNATLSPYYEINGVQITSLALSDASNLAYLSASNTFTGTTQTAPVWNATSGFEVGGIALASTNLSDSSDLARLNASNVFTGTTNTFNAITGTTINATSGFEVGGIALSASNLSNGVSGTGAVCLSSGSACAPSLTSVGISSSSTPLTVSGSPLTSSGTITLGLSLVGTESKLVTASSSGTATHCANWLSTGGIGDAGAPCYGSPSQTIYVSHESGSGRGLNTAYQNTSTSMVLDVSVSLNCTAQCALTCGVGSTSSSITDIGENGYSGGGGDAFVSIKVLPSYYYECYNSGGYAVDYWVETLF